MSQSMSPRIESDKYKANKNNVDYTKLVHKPITVEHWDRV